MFKYDIPIENPNDDILSRKRFSEKLSEAIQNWDGKESLVIAIYGEWGSGKSSSINLAKYYLQKLFNKNRPTIIDFNPWLFPDIEKLTEIFFNEISHELEIRNENKHDSEIAKKLRRFSNLLEFVPNKSFLLKIKSKVLAGLGLIGVSSSQISSSLNLSNKTINIILFLGGVLFLILEITKEYIANTVQYLKNRIDKSEKTILEVKKDIRNELLKREKKLLIVIDDIDRLESAEIRDVFRLLKSNADFPNTIYLLAFDRNVIVENLEQQPGISGSTYLEKIVQVNFDIPHINLQRLSKFLFSELDRILSKLPESGVKLFDTSHWSNIYNSGYKDFFTNLRVIKRYVNSLEFNISLMHQSGSMEVNPIDFFAIEAIRLFVPKFYIQLKNKKTLFTETTSDSYSMSVNREKVLEKRKEEIEQLINELKTNYQSIIRGLIQNLFPQLSGVYQRTHYSDASYTDWSKQLRVCSPKCFDAYFTLIPGGDEDELNQYEIDRFLNNIDNVEKLEELLITSQSENKLRELLARLQNYTDDIVKIPTNNAENLFTALFNITDNLPDDKKGMFDWGADMDVMRIIHQVLKRNNNLEENYNILRNSIERSKTLYGPIQKISLETSDERARKEMGLLIPENKLDELRKIGLERIRTFVKDYSILKNKNFVYILYRWKEWGSEDEINNFVNDVKVDDNRLLQFVKSFVFEQRIQSLESPSFTIREVLNKKSLNEFIALDEIKERFINILSDENLDTQKRIEINNLLKKLDEKDKEY